VYTSPHELHRYGNSDEGILGTWERQSTILKTMSSHLMLPGVFGPACVIVSQITQYKETPEFTMEHRQLMMATLYRGMRHYHDNAAILNRAIGAIHSAATHGWHADWLRTGDHRKEILSTLGETIDKYLIGSGKDQNLIAKIMWIFAFLSLNDDFLSLLAAPATRTGILAKTGGDMGAGKETGGYVAKCANACAAFGYKHMGANSQLLKMLDALSLGPTQVQRDVIAQVRRGVERCI
jgi:hypothetical protein